MAVFVVLMLIKIKKPFNFKSTKIIILINAFFAIAGLVAIIGIMLSADNAHALHPNHPELSDTKRAPVLNGGVVLKRQASQRYTTDALSAALVHRIAEKAGVPLCEYANRSDIIGGSTLGAIATTKVSMLTADIGLPQLSMHSSYETAGSLDSDYMIRFSKTFYESDPLCEKEGILFI